MQESHATELRKAREEAAVSMSREVLEEYKAKINTAVKVVEEARQRDKDQVEQLRTRVKKARRSVRELREELDGWRREKVSLRGRIGALTAEKDRMRDEKEGFTNRVISLQAQLDQMEEFKDTVNQMLQDTYYRVWETHGLAWMNDYPQVMAGIHKRVQDNLIAGGHLSGDAPSDSLLVDSHFTTEEVEAIQQGYKLLAEEEAEEETDDPGTAGHCDRAAKGNLFPMT